MKGSIAKKLIFITLLAILLPIVTGGIILSHEIKNHVGQTKLDDLMNIIDARYIHILDFIEGQKRAVRAMGDDHFLHQTLIRYHGLNPTDAPPDREAALGQIQAYLDQLQQSSQLSPHAMQAVKEQDAPNLPGHSPKWNMFRLNEPLYRYHEALIIGPGGKVVASSDHRQIGNDLSGSDLFKNGRHDNYIKDLYSDRDGHAVMAFATPIIEQRGYAHPERTESLFLGVAVLKISADYLTDLTTGDLGNRIGGRLFFGGYTPATDFYIINKAGYMITQSIVLKGQRETVLKQRAKTLPWQRCTDERQKVRTVKTYYRNYAGVPVGGASMCVFELQWTVVVEQPRDDILMLFQRIKHIMFTADLVILIGASLLLLLLIRKIILLPLAQLSAATRRLQEGDYSARVSLDSHDEIGQLATLFNRMAADLQQSAHETLANEKMLETSLQQLSREIEAKEQAKNELQVNNQQLEKIIDWRTRELSKVNKHLSEEMARHEEAQRRAEEANQAKSEFLANMSHELRTPMHAILSFASMGEEKVERATRERLKRYFSRIRESGERLLYLLNDLLDLSKLEAGRMELNLQTHDLKELVEGVAIELSGLARDKSLTLEILPPDIATTLRLDHDKISQVVRNLLSNAIKFTPGGKQIHISFARTRLPAQEGSPQRPAIEVSVADEGVGIPAEELELVFDKFAQSSKTKTGGGGTGLGLAISREIINRHQGVIRAENNPGGGAIFRFALPCEEAPRQDQAP